MSTSCIDFFILRERKVGMEGSGRKGRDGGKEGDNPSFHPSMHSLVDSFVCPNWRSIPTTLVYGDKGLTN